jgi:ribonuclease H2 subunit C
MISILAAREPTAPSHAHMLPCEVQYTGSAPVSQYFKPQPVEGKPQQRVAAFRGRKMCGVALELPEGYTGAVLQDTVQAAVADGEERRWMHRGKIDSFTYWKQDEFATENEPVLQAVKFAGIASVLHAHYDDDEA